MEIEPQHYKQCLDELLPQMGNYDWMWKILKLRTRHTGWFPRKIHASLLRFGNPRKPYFIGCTGKGIKFVGDYRDEYAATCVVCPEYDLPVISFIKDHLTDTKGAYIDVGANLGVVAASIAQHLQGKMPVIAFEPVAETARRAAATFALNDSQNIRLFQIAVGDEDKEIVFYDAPGHSEWASTTKTQQEDVSIEWQETKVMQRSLDSLVQDKVFDKVSFLKIDVEGYEPQVVQGAKRLIAQNRPHILYEYNSSVAPQAGWKADDIVNMVNKIVPYKFQALQLDNSLTSTLPQADDKGVYNIYGTSAGTAAA